MVAEPKNPGQAKLRDWPMFRRLPGGRRQSRAASRDGRPLPRIAELLVSQLPGSAADKLAWLAAQKSAGKLDGDNPDEIAEAEALLAMLVRIAESKSRKQHLDALLDAGLTATFPASDPVSVGHFTGAEAWPRADRS